jgi:hypothetical protein
MDRLESLVDLGDVDELVREIDRRVDATDWDGLVRLRLLCRAALDRGKQLWPAASLAEYRLALDAPGPWAATVLVEGTGQFCIGPLSEVAASTHTWDELSPHLDHGPIRTLVAHERALRGEATGERDEQLFEMPIELQAWEPSYALATYRRDGVEAPQPPLPELVEMALKPGGAVIDDPATEALRELVGVWLRDSNGRCDVVAVEGSALQAISFLGPPRLRIGRLTVAEAAAHMAWAAATGGAHGRRRGAAAGRFNAWWAIAALGDLNGIPANGDHLGDAAASLEWWWWDAYEPHTGWRLQLAVHDPIDEVAWAIGARDAAD